MIPHSITDTGLVFIARGRTYPITRDNHAFETIRKILLDGSATEDVLIRGVDICRTMLEVSGGRVTTQDDHVRLDGVILPGVWCRQVIDDPTMARLLIIEVGQKIRIESDEDAPDGVYEVKGIDPVDVERRFYLEEDDGFFGYISNSSVKEIVP